jgi:hypothetical protein
MEAETLLKKLHTAFNKRDIDLLMECFASDYSSEQPVYPGRAFKGAEQVEKNWASNFNEMPDFSSHLVNYTIGNNTLWAEWNWEGTRLDKTKLHMRGVTIFGIDNHKINWGRLYMEPVKTGGTGIEDAIKEVMHGKKADK